MGVQSQDGSAAAGGPEQVHEHADGGGLARAVGAEVAENLAGLDLDVQVYGAGALTVVLGQALSVDDGVIQGDVGLPLA